MLTSHITFSVGWLGAVVAYLVLAIIGLGSHDIQMVRAAYLSMGAIGWFVIVPFSLATLLIGVVQSLTSSWGLFRYWWVLVKFSLTLAAVAILLRHMQTVNQMTGIASNPGLSVSDFHTLQIQLVVHAAGGLLVLLVATILSVYKPWGMTPYGLRKQNEKRKIQQVEVPSRPELSMGTSWESSKKTPKWVYVVGIHAIGLVTLFLVVHLAGGGLRGH